jgi:hypothetical protein
MRGGCATGSCRRVPQRIVGDVRPPFTFAAWVVSAVVLSVLLFAAIVRSNGGDAGALVMLFVLPGFLTLIGAVRTQRSRWTIALAPLLCSVLTFVTVVAVLIAVSDRPFD